MVSKSKKKSVKKGGRKSSSRKKDDDLTIHFMPYSEIAREDTVGRIKKIMALVRDNKIIILQGVLRPDEEARLIEHSMILAGSLEGFSGIEIASLSGENRDDTVFSRFRRNMARMLVGERDQITIIGPASVVKDMKRDPTKMELMLQRR